ncbi:ATP-binding protein [uncultured Dokdonia sp.]|uniref:AAA family ATPase n=1 Tax=uncultured Dokdonia sp. TaxID=575653 RepID=UPI00344CE008
MILGNTGAGKTTYALSLRDKEQGVIFSIDHWNKTLFLDDKTPEDGVDWFLERIERSDTMIQSIVAQMATAGTPAILDLGFAKKERRDRFYAFAKAYNIPIQLHFLDIPLEIRKQRVMQRNQEKGETFQFEVSETDVEFMESWFEKPTPKELAHAHIITT